MNSGARPRRPARWRGELSTYEVLAACAVALVALTLLQVLAVGPARLSIVPWLALPPLAASLVLGWRRTAVVSVVSVAVVVALSEWAGSPVARDGVLRILGAASLAGFAVVNAAVRVAREERVRRVTEVATVAQATILHPVPAQAGSLRLASRYVSSAAHASVGGDLFDVVDTYVGVRIIIGDVRGKGLPAVRTASVVLNAFRHVAPQASVSLVEVALAVQEALDRTLGEEDFVTGLFVQVAEDGTFEVVNCGHPAPLVVTPGRAPRALDPVVHAAPLGLASAPRSETFSLAEDERLLLHTDGLVEARDAGGSFLDLEQAASVLARPGSDLDESLEALLDVVRTHVGGELTDDLAVLLAERLPVCAEPLPVPGPRQDGLGLAEEATV